MTETYNNIMVAIDGSPEAELAFVQGIHIAERNQARLTLVHVIDTRALQSVTTFDGQIYEQLQDDADRMMDEYDTRAREAGLHDIKTVIEFGNPKPILATQIPDSEGIDLILVGATGLNAFERIMIGSSSEYILRHTKVDLLVVREGEKLI